MKKGSIPHKSNRSLVTTSTKRGPKDAGPPDPNGYRALLQCNVGGISLTLGRPAGWVALALIARIDPDRIHEIAHKGLLQLLDMIAVAIQIVHLFIGKL